MSAQTTPPARLVARCWAWCAQPTLVRRLLLGQALTLSLLWVAVVVAVLSDTFSEELFQTRPTYDAIIQVTDSLADQPDKQWASLRTIEAALRDSYSDHDDPEMAPSIMVWKGDRLVYKTVQVPDSLANTAPGLVEKLESQGRHWYMRTQQSAHSDTRVALLMPTGIWPVFLTFNSRGYFMLPLIVSAPFLLLPAWLSIRLALRPWRRLGQEIAARGPHDLSPLGFAPRHAELRPLVDNINALMQRLRESGERERRFIADAAHELRTPIAAMRVNVEALQTQRSLSERQSELLSGVLRSSDRATRLVGQLLRLMRSNAETPVAIQQPLQFDALVQERLAEMAALAQSRKVELELLVQTQQAGAALLVRGEREDLMSLVDNLIDNATKYSPQGEAVQVELGRDGDWAMLTVSDRGPGIAPALRERVFDRFYRSPDQTQTGSGLGLAIVKAVVEKNRGRVVLEDAPGSTSGLQVRVYLPLA
ncbi:MAG: sensor histidine kinase [Acidovorax sp.]|jgi:two-component system sensor histidine kinase QseC|nr:sensor histidine kinase [Acidovorax sp.]